MVAPRLLTLIDYLLGTLHAWIREGANDLTLGRWWERYRMRDGQDCIVRHCTGATSAPTSPLRWPQPSGVIGGDARSGWA